MKPERFQRYMDKQKKMIEEYKWCESEKACKDLGQEAALDWIKKYAKKFRKDFVLSDLREAMSELMSLQEGLNTYLKEIQKLSSIIINCQEKIIEGIELIETETNGDSNGK